MSEETAVQPQKVQGFFIGETFRSAWDLFKKEWITVYAVQLIPLAFIIVYGLIVGEPEYPGDNPSALVQLIYFVVQLILSMGVTKAFLSIIRNEKVTLETFTSVLPLTLKYIAVTILFMLIVLGGLLLLVIPGFIFSIKYMFAPYLVIDKGMGPIEALKASAKMTDGVKWDIIGFSGAVTILMYSGLFALIVGLLITLPLGTLAFFMLYNKLVKRLE